VGRDEEVGREEVEEVGLVVVGSNEEERGAK
jgi:hypothetical protein